VIVVNTNDRHHLEKCLPSLLAQDYPDFEVLIVDNASSDGSPSWLAEAFPTVKVIRNRENLGYTGANNAGVRQATGRYVAIMNPDTSVEQDWLTEIIRVLEADPDAGVATPKIVMMGDPQRINTCGNDLHFTGLTLCRGLGAHRDAFSGVSEVSAVSGAAFVMSRELFEGLGGFDEEFFLYMEDTDLSWRTRLAGYRCLCVPSSVVLHDYALRFGPRKVFYQERNRYQMWLKGWRWGTWCVLLPALLLAEVVTWAFVLFRQPGQARNKLRAYAWIVRHWGDIMARRRRTQALRRVPDRELLAGCTWRLNLAQFDRGVLGRASRSLLDPLFFVLHRAALALVRW
jgi:GT2 family glycosyltransferase